MSVESGIDLIEERRIPVAPVYTRFDDVVARVSTGAEAAEFVPPYFVSGFEEEPGFGSVELGSAPDRDAEIESGTGHDSVMESVENSMYVETLAVEEQLPEAELAAAAATVESEFADEFEERDVDLSAVETAEASGPAEEVREEEVQVEEQGMAVETIASWDESNTRAPESSAAYELAARLETIAERLRTDGTAAVVAGMRGDRLDALLAGVFAGYLAAQEADK